MPGLLVLQTCLRQRKFPKEIKHAGPEHRQVLVPRCGPLLPALDYLKVFLLKRSKQLPMRCPVVGQLNVSRPVREHAKVGVAIGGPAIKHLATFDEEVEHPNLVGQTGGEKPVQLSLKCIKHVS